MPSVVVFPDFHPNAHVTWAWSCNEPFRRILPKKNHVVNCSFTTHFCLDYEFFRFFFGAFILWGKDGERCLCCLRSGVCHSSHDQTESRIYQSDWIEHSSNLPREDFQHLWSKPSKHQVVLYFFHCSMFRRKKQKAPVSLVEISTAPDMVSRTALAGMPPLPPLVLRRGPQWSGGRTQHLGVIIIVITVVYYPGILKIFHKSETCRSCGQQDDSPS